VKVLRFGGIVEILRRAQGLTHGDLSRKSGVPERSLERICAGKNAPSAAHFVRLMKALKVHLDAIEPEDLEEEGIA
jgi:transcriptional regulator with XRE-family HTH domain